MRASEHDAAELGELVDLLARILPGRYPSGFLGLGDVVRLAVVAAVHEPERHLVAARAELVDARLQLLPQVAVAVATGGVGLPPPPPHPARQSQRRAVDDVDEVRQDDDAAPPFNVPGRNCSKVIAASL